MTKKKKRGGPLYDAMMAAMREQGERLRAAEQAIEQAQADFELAAGRFIEPYLRGAKAQRLWAPKSKRLQQLQGWQATLVLSADFDQRQYRTAYLESQGEWKNHAALAQWAPDGTTIPTVHKRLGIELHCSWGPVISFPVGMGKAEVHAWLQARGIEHPTAKSNSDITLELEAPCEDFFLPLFTDENQLRELLGQAAVSFDRIKHVNDGPMFLGSLPYFVGGTSLRVILDPYFTPEGHVRFIEVQRGLAVE